MTAIKSIKLEVTGLEYDAWLQVRELLVAVVLCGMRDGCRASNTNLRRVANSNRRHPVIGSATTFGRVQKKAVEMRLLRVIARANKRGRDFSFREVCQDQVAELVRRSRELSAEKRVKPENGARGEHHLGTTWESPEHHPPYIQTNQTSLTKQSKRSTGDQRKVWKPEELGRIVDRARRAAKVLGTPSNKPDLSLLLKASALAEGRLSEHWFHDAVEGVNRRRGGRPENPWAYFYRCLSDRIGNGPFRQALATVDDRPLLGAWAAANEEVRCEPS